MDKEKRLKMAVIAGASKALHLKALSPHEADDKILKRISNQTEEIVNNIDDDF